MQYELMTHRGLHPDPKMPLRFLLYAYSKYCKEREEAAGRTLLNGNHK